MTPNTGFQVKEVQIKEMREHLSLYEELDLFRNLTAFAVLDQNTQKYLLKVVDNNNGGVLVIRLERIEDGLRTMNLGTIAKNIRDFGFTNFTVLMEGDV